MTLKFRIRTSWHQFWGRLHDEQGGSQIMILAIVMGAILLVPFFFDFASVHYSRRTTQTGADAAVMAAAKEYSLELSLRGGQWMGLCAEPKISVVGRYWMFIQPIQYNRNIGLPWAQQFAQANRIDLTQFQVLPSSNFKMVDGVPIFYMYANAETKRQALLTMQEQYNNTYRTSAYAWSEIYLDRFEVQEVPCTYAGEPNVLYIYTFFWKEALVERPF